MRHRMEKPINRVTICGSCGKKCTGSDLLYVERMGVCSDCSVIDVSKKMNRIREHIISSIDISMK